MSDIYQESASLIVIFFDPVYFYVFAGIAAILGILIKGKVEKQKFLLSWITLGVVTTLLLQTISEIGWGVITGILLGFSLGLGFPMILAHIADNTFIEERARVSGIVISLTFGLSILASLIIELLPDISFTILLIFALVRSSSFLGFFGRRFGTEKEFIDDSLPRQEYKNFFLYIIPWLVFILVGILATSLITSIRLSISEFQDPIRALAFKDAIELGSIFFFFGITIFGLITGYFADKIGRKPFIIIGLIILSTSFGILGWFDITPNIIVLYRALGGIAWGFILTIYLVIPGDLSVYGSREKFYSLLVIFPWLLLMAVPIILNIINFNPNPSNLSQILLYICIIPVILPFIAKETLPETKMRERKMKNHINKISELISDSKKER